MTAQGRRSGYLGALTRSSCEGFEPSVGDLRRLASRHQFGARRPRMIGPVHRRFVVDAPTHEHDLHCKLATTLCGNVVADVLRAHSVDGDNEVTGAHSGMFGGRIGKEPNQWNSLALVGPFAFSFWFVLHGCCGWRSRPKFGGRLRSGASHTHAPSHAKVELDRTERLRGAG
jgi:hypothetical protein